MFRSNSQWSLADEMICEVRSEWYKGTYIHEKDWMKIVPRRGGSEG